MKNNIFRGLGIALITPFTEDGAVDFAALKNVVEYQLENGADFLCILATTGETPCLSKQERLAIQHFVVKLVNGKVPIVVGCGGNNTALFVRNYRMAILKASTASSAYAHTITNRLKKDSSSTLKPLPDLHACQ